MISETFSVALSIAVDPEQLAGAFEAAAPREAVIYAYGLDLPRAAAAVALARKWAAEGRGHLVQQRDPADRRRTRWMIVKAGIGVARPPAMPLARDQVGQGAMLQCDSLLRLLRAQAPTCPSDREIARQLGLGTDQPARRRAGYLLGLLVKQGAIALTNNGHGQLRTVAIVEQRA